jgi:hypothetical protein
MDELSYQIRRVAPPDGLFGAAWQTYSVSSRGVPVWESACFSTIDPFIEALRTYPSALVVKNLYYTHATFKAPDLSRRNPPRLDRRISNLHATRTLAIDGDVKPGAFSSTTECKQTISSMLAEIGLKSSFIVFTSAPFDVSLPVAAAGMHLYLVMARLPSLEDRKTMALDLVAALKHRGLVFDTGVTTDAVRVLRSCGSLNRKTDEVRIARLDLESIDGPDYDPDELKIILARARPPHRTHNNLPLTMTRMSTSLRSRAPPISCLTMVTTALGAISICAICSSAWRSSHMTGLTSTMMSGRCSSASLSPPGAIMRTQWCGSMVLSLAPPAMPIRIA